MAVIKRPIKKVLFYLSSLLGIVFALIAGMIFKNSQYSLSQLEDKANDLFKAVSISSAEAQCWIVPAPSGCSGCAGGGDGGDSGDSGDGPGSSCSSGSDGTAGASAGGGSTGDGGSTGGGSMG